MGEHRKWQNYGSKAAKLWVKLQLLPNDGDAKGRPVLIGVRSHLDAPIVQMLRLDELGLLPPAITALIEQLKAELPARAQAAGQLAAKAKEQAERKTPTVKASDKRGKTPLAKRDQAPAPAPQPSVLTDEQRANAVALVTTDDKQQLAMF